VPAAPVLNAWFLHRSLYGGVSEVSNKSGIGENVISLPKGAGGKAPSWFGHLWLSANIEVSGFHVPINKSDRAGKERKKTMNPLIRLETKKTMKTISNLICAAFAIAVVAISAVTANGAPGDLIASINGALQNGEGFIYSYTPNGVQSTFASGLSRPRGLAFDSVGNLFVATNFCEGNGAVIAVTPRF
jgi:hypothetical protein